MVGGSTRIPAIQEAVKKLIGKEPHKGVNPDEVVAMGAALQAGMIAGDVKGVVLLDVTPLSLGIETLGGVFTQLIERNTTIPTEKSQIFSTAADNQTSVEIHVLQGERPMANQNVTLGRFTLDGLPPAPRGIPQIEVKFDIDVNGIVNVTAKDMATGKTQHITITSSSGLSKEEIERMVNDAEKHAAEDSKFKELVELRNSGDHLVYSTEKLLKDLGDKVPADKASAINAAMDKLKETMKADDVDAIKSASEELTKYLNELSTMLYSQAAEQQGTAQGGDADASDETVDAEYKVDDDETPKN